MSKVAIVTGGNKGIGYETVRGLVKSKEFGTVYLTARNETLGKEAVQKLSDEESALCVKFHQLDIADTESVSKFAKFITETHGGFDVLVQNAGFAFKAAATESFDIQARETFKINVWGTLDVMKKFVPLVRENGRIVNVSSFTSQMAATGFTPKFGNPIHQKLGMLNQEISLEEMEKLAAQFVSDCADKKNEELGWPTSAYATSKLFVNIITRVFARQIAAENKGVLINCCCPGFVKTDMTSQSERARKYPSDGCKTSLWLALVAPGAPGPQGCFLCDA